MPLWIEGLTHTNQCQKKVSSLITKGSFYKRHQYHFKRVPMGILEKNMSLDKKYMLELWLPAHIYVIKDDLGIPWRQYMTQYLVM